ncbi:hypothetical protein Dimus_006269 [Dionaea muscipula]
MVMVEWFGSDGCGEQVNFSVGQAMMVWAASGGSRAMLGNGRWLSLVIVALFLVMKKQGGGVWCPLPLAAVAGERAMGWGGGGVDWAVVDSAMVMVEWFGSDGCGEQVNFSVGQAMMVWAAGGGSRLMLGDGRWLSLVVNGEGRSGQPPPRLVVGKHGDGVGRL